MKNPVPLFAVLSFSLLLASACAPSNSNVDDGKQGYTSPVPATGGDMSDTGDYNQRNRGADTLNPVAPPPPTRPDSTNRMPPR